MIFLIKKIVLLYNMLSKIFLFIFEYKLILYVVGHPPSKSKTEWDKTSRYMQIAYYNIQVYNARIKSIRNAFSHLHIHGSPFSSLLPYPIALLRLIHNPTALKFSREKSVVFFVHNRETGAGTNSHQTPPLPACWIQSLLAICIWIQT